MYVPAGLLLVRFSFKKIELGVIIDSHEETEDRAIVGSQGSIIQSSETS